MCKNLSKLLMTSVLCFTLYSIKGCTISTAHQQFIDSMNDGLLGNKKIYDLDYDPQYPQGYFIADHRYLTGKEFLKRGLVKYHYARPNLWEGRYCHYYLIVKSDTQEVLGWGFDSELSEPTKECGSSG